MTMTTTTKRWCKSILKSAADVSLGDGDLRKFANAYVLEFHGRSFGF